MAKSHPLRYIGDDKKHAATLKDGIQWFEPVDAKEVLASENEDYEELDAEEVVEHEDRDGDGNDKPTPVKKARKRR